MIAIPIGIYSAVRKYSLADYFVTAGSFFGISMPTFWFGLMLMIVFAVDLHVLPTTGVSTPGLESDVTDRVKHLLMPVAVLTLFNVAHWSRFMRSSMLEVLSLDYLRTARSRGLRGECGRHPPRGPQRAHPGDHDPGTRHPGAFLGGGDYRDHLLVAGHGPPLGAEYQC